TIFIQEKDMEIVKLQQEISDQKLHLKNEEDKNSLLKGEIENLRVNLKELDELNNAKEIQLNEAKTKYLFEMESIHKIRDSLEEKLRQKGDEVDTLRNTVQELE